MSMHTHLPHLLLPQVFQRDELEVIAELCQKHDLLCVSDEVYEWLVHDGKHTRTGESAALIAYKRREP